MQHLHQGGNGEVLELRGSTPKRRPLEIPPVEGTSPMRHLEFLACEPLCPITHFTDTVSVNGAFRKGLGGTLALRVGVGQVTSRPGNHPVRKGRDTVRSFFLETLAVRLISAPLPRPIHRWRPRTDCHERACSGDRLDLKCWPGL